MIRDLSHKASRPSSRAWRVSLAFLLILGLVQAAGAQISNERPTTAPTPADEVVDRYAAALKTYDLDKMSAMWTDDVVYSDPTAGARFEGRESTLETLRGMVGDAAGIRIDIRQRFISNGYAVLTIHGSMKMTDPASGRSLEVSAPGVIVLQLDGERIAAQTDYVDYDSVRQQVAASGMADSWDGQ